jgi:transposase
MAMEGFLDRLRALEERVRTLEAENQQLREENQQLRDENAKLKQRVAELESALRHKAASQASKPPNINFGVDRNKPDKEKTTKQQKTHTPSPGRTPDEQKLKNADRIVDIYPPNISPEECVLRDEQGVWRFLDGMQAKRRQTADGSLQQTQAEF